LKPEAPLKVSELIATMDAKYKAFDLLGARDLAMETARNCNNWLAKLEPWKMKDDQVGF
jgi:methionyl-tRNA synthetase